MLQLGAGSVMGVTLPGNRQLVRRSMISYSEAATALLDTTHLVVTEWAPRDVIRTDIERVLRREGLQQLTHVSLAFDGGLEVQLSCQLLALLGANCPSLQHVGLVRVGKGEPPRLDRLRGCSMKVHLSSAAAQFVRSLRTDQQPAVETAGMFSGLAAVGSLTAVRELNVTDGYTLNSVGREAPVPNKYWYLVGNPDLVSADDRRAVQPLPALPLAVYGALIVLRITHVRGGAAMLPIGMLIGLAQLCCLEVPGMEDVPLVLPPALTKLVIGAVRPAGLGRAAASPTLSVLTICSADMYPSVQRPTLAWPLLMLHDVDIRQFSSTCRHIAEANRRGLLPIAICMWKVRCSASRFWHLGRGQVG